MSATDILSLLIKKCSPFRWCLFQNVHSIPQQKRIVSELQHGRERDHMVEVCRSATWHLTTVAHGHLGRCQGAVWHELPVQIKRGDPHSPPSLCTTHSWRTLLGTLSLDLRTMKNLTAQSGLTGGNTGENFVQQSNKLWRPWAAKEEKKRTASAKTVSQNFLVLVVSLF